MWGSSMINQNPSHTLTQMYSIHFPTWSPSAWSALLHILKTFAFIKVSKFWLKSNMLIFGPTLNLHQFLPTRDENGLPHGTFTLNWLGYLYLNMHLLPNWYAAWDPSSMPELSFYIQNYIHTQLDLILFLVLLRIR